MTKYEQFRKLYGHAETETFRETAAPVFRETGTKHAGYTSVMVDVPAADPTAIRAGSRKIMTTDGIAPVRHTHENGAPELERPVIRGAGRARRSVKIAKYAAAALAKKVQEKRETFAKISAENVQNSSVIADALANMRAETEENAVLNAVEA